VHQLAQVNVARLRAGLDSAQLRDFVAAVDPVNRLAEESPGFVWRLKAGEGHIVTTLPDGSSSIVVNLSVWQSYEALHVFVYRSVHGVFVRRRALWFVPTQQPSTALWWVPAGEEPTVDEAMRRMIQLQRYGPSPRAFSLRQRFTPDGRPVRSARLPRTRSAQR